MNLDIQDLSIGELATRSGMQVATIRAWERRHGFPVPRRLPGGHRRYSERDVAALIEVRRQRHEGGTLTAALASARCRNNIPRSSIMRTVRHLMDATAPVELAKPTLLALTRAVEDEVAARADHPMLVGAFQRDRFRIRSQDRWAEISRTARATIVFAVPGRPGRPLPSGLTALEGTDAMAREWALICDSPSFAACVVGSERPPRSDGGRHQTRLFEVLWTVHPRIVREAARTAVSLAGVVRPELGKRLAGELERLPIADVDAVAHEGPIANRLLRDLDRALAGPN